MFKRLRAVRLLALSSFCLVSKLSQKSYHFFPKLRLLKIYNVFSMKSLTRMSGRDNRRKMTRLGDGRKRAAPFEGGRGCVLRETPPILTV